MKSEGFSEHLYRALMRQVSDGETFAYKDVLGPVFVDGLQRFGKLQKQKTI